MYIQRNVYTGCPKKKAEHSSLRVIFLNMRRKSCLEFINAYISLYFISILTQKYLETNRHSIISKLSRFTNL